MNRVIFYSMGTCPHCHHFVTGGAKDKELVCRYCPTIVKVDGVRAMVVKEVKA